MQRDRLIHRAIPVLTGVVLGVALVLVTSQQVADDGSKDIDAVGLVLCLITGLSLAFRRSHPLGQFVVAISATIAYAAFDYPGGPIFVVAFASALAMVYEQRSLMPAAFIGGAALLAVQFAVYGWAVHLFGFAAVWFVGTALFGEAMRLRREQQRTTEERAEFAERTREQEARRRVAEERLRIARDVHDVVGHSLATIALQAGVAEHLLDGREPKARESIASHDPPAQQGGARRGERDARRDARRGRRRACPDPRPLGRHRPGRGHARGRAEHRPRARITPRARGGGRGRVPDSPGVADQRGPPRRPRGVGARAGGRHRRRRRDRGVR